MNDTRTLVPARTTTSRIAALLASVVLAALAAIVGGSAPAHATSACDYASRSGAGFFGSYVTPYGGGAARSSCATIVTPTRYSAHQVTFSGWLKDTATNGKNAALYAQFRVNGQWGTWRIIANDGTESWHVWSYPVTASGRVDMIQIRACEYSAAGGLQSCGDPVVAYNF